MKCLHGFSRSFIFILLTLPCFIAGCSPEDTNEVTSIANTDTAVPVSVDDTVLDEHSAEEVSGLDVTEASHLSFMREEEKLARDVYLTLADFYPDQQIFNQIATRAEQTHTDTMRDKLDQFDLPDPNPDTNN